ncbi:unnamed protein product [Colias eurytheme]|nr:unnamed protein product [Colias eurytheme]
MPRGPCNVRASVRRRARSLRSSLATSRTACGPRPPRAPHRTHPTTFPNQLQYNSNSVKRTDSTIGTRYASLLAYFWPALDTRPCWAELGPNLGGPVEECTLATGERIQHKYGQFNSITGTRGLWD